MQRYNTQKEAVEMNGEGICKSRTFWWPTIKISAACIENPALCTPENMNKVNIIPTVKRYFYVTVANIVMTGGTTMPATNFYNDDGSPTIEFMNFSPNGYADLYINAVIQEGGMFEVLPDSLIIKPSNSIIYRGTPIILEIITFTAIP